MIANLVNSKVIAFPMLASSSSSASSPLLTWPPVALANRVAAQFQHQEQLLEEARGQLALHKEALLNSERARHDLEEGFECERQALNDEISQLKRVMHAYEERFRQGKGALGDGAFEVGPLLCPIDIMAFFERPPYESSPYGYANGCVVCLSLRRPLVRIHRQSLPTPNRTPWWEEAAQPRSLLLGNGFSSDRRSWRVFDP